MARVCAYTRGTITYRKIFIEFTQSDHYGTVRLWTFFEQERSTVTVRAEHKDDALGPVFEVYRDARNGAFVELKHYRP